MRLRQSIRKNFKFYFFFLLLLFCLYSTFLYLTAGQRGYDNVLVVLASQFIKRKITLPIYNLPPRDIANYYNNYYVYFGPLASLILMPFVFLFGQKTPEVLIGIISMVVSFFAVYKIGIQFKFSRTDCLYLSLFFVFSTVLFSSSVINITAYQVESLGAPCILLALWAYFSKKSPYLIGLFIGLAILTRFTLMLSVAFFFIELVKKRVTFKQFVKILIPVIIVLALLGAYNNRRFHSIFETGYNYSTTKDASPIGLNLNYGDISLIHVPANLYSFLIMSPEPLLARQDGGLVLKFPYLSANPWGFAIWYSSPLFILLIARFKKGKYSFSAGITAFLLSLPVFLWYSIGYAQLGYRYTLDFLPFLFLLLLPGLSPKLSRVALVLITIGVIFNCVYSDSLWQLYPIFNIYH